MNSVVPGAVMTGKTQILSGEMGSSYTALAVEEATEKVS